MLKTKKINGKWISIIIEIHFPFFNSNNQHEGMIITF